MIRVVFLIKDAKILTNPLNFYQVLPTVVAGPEKLIKNTVFVQRTGFIFEPGP